VNLGSFAPVLANAIMVLIPMILSLTVHEFSHAYVARKLGDNTAEMMGRLNLNPLSHADPVGTVLLPLMILMANGAGGMGRIPFFGWAKPVPINPGRFTRKISVRWGNALVASAGPLSNLGLAVLCGGALSVLLHTGWVAQFPEPFFLFLKTMFGINIALCVFNMIPIYPLDGEKVVSGFLRPELSIQFERFNRQYGTWVLWGIIFLGRGLIAVPIGWVSTGVLTAVGLS
jgi:Zn-dependent protease